MFNTVGGGKHLGCLRQPFEQHIAHASRRLGPIILVGCLPPSFALVCAAKGVEHHVECAAIQHNHPCTAPLWRTTPQGHSCDKDGCGIGHACGGTLDPCDDLPDTSSA